MELTQNHKWMFIKLGIIAGALMLLGYSCSPARHDVIVKVEGNTIGHSGGVARPGDELSIVYGRRGWTVLSQRAIITITEGASFDADENGCGSEALRRECPIPVFEAFKRSFSAQIDADLSDTITVIKVNVSVQSTNFKPFGFTENFSIQIVRPDVTVFDPSASAIAVGGSTNIPLGTNTFRIRNTSTILENQDVTVAGVSIAGDAGISLVSSIADTILAQNAETTFDIVCDEALTQPATATVTVNNSVLAKAAYSFDVTCDPGHVMMYVEYEGTRVPEGSTVQIVPGFANFQIGFLAEPQPGVALDIRNLTLNGSNQIVPDSIGVRSNMVLPNQETFFILECRARTAGSYSTTVMIETNLAELDFYTFDVLCVVDETQSGDGLTGAGEVPGGGGNDLNNPPPSNNPPPPVEEEELCIDNAC